MLKLKVSEESVSVTRFKGLGEMNPAQLRETTLQVNTRKLALLKLSTDIADKNYEYAVVKKF